MRVSIKEIRKKEFVKATREILINEGLAGFSARKVAATTGYNAASIYTYFKNLDHLENLASIHFTYAYVHELNTTTRKLKSPFDAYIAMWESFTKHAFLKPNYFYNVFFSAISHNVEINLFREYYTLFPEEKPQGGLISGMIEISQTDLREKFVLELCAKEEYIQPDMLPYLNEVQLRCFKSILTDIVKSSLYQPTPELYHHFLVTFLYTLMPYTQKKGINCIKDVLDFHKSCPKNKFHRYFN